MPPSLMQDSAVIGPLIPYLYKLSDLVASIIVAFSPSKFSSLSVPLYQFSLYGYLKQEREYSLMWQPSHFNLSHISPEMKEQAMEYGKI